MTEKEIRFTEKRIDDAWKESVKPYSRPSKTTHGVESKESDEPARSEINLSNFLASLGVQCLIQLGEIQAPGSQERTIDLDGAKETIDLLLVLKEKTKKNLTAHEEGLLAHLLSDLQIKFVAKQQPIS